MNTIESIKKILNPLCLYNLEDNSLITKELTVYANELDILRTETQKILTEFFINTAIDYGLYLREKLFGSIKSGLSINERRRILLSRYSSESYEFNREAVEKTLISAGIDGYVTEYPQSNSIYINCLNMFDTTITKEMAKKIVLEFIPAHLNVTFDFRNLTWDYIESLNLTFNEFDEKDLTWEEIDDYS